MGCYGIGVSRTIAAAIEQGHDEDGIIFPPALAPFTVIVTLVGAKNSEIEEAANASYGDLWNNSIDTLLDDRDERPGVKFKDADLVGIPFRVTIGKKALAEGKVELRNRKTKQMKLVEISVIVRQSERGWRSGERNFLLRGSRHEADSNSEIRGNPSVLGIKPQTCYKWTGGAAID